MVKFNSDWLLILLVYICQFVLIRASCRANSKIERKNNDDLHRCLLWSLPLIVRTIYPCKTFQNQNSSEYECDDFNVSQLSSIHGGRIDHSPGVIVYVRNSNDVQNVVKCALKLNYIVNALSGGHSYEGYGLGSIYNNIIINMKLINYIKINQRDKTGRFGAGTRLGPIYYETYQYDNYTISAGSCPWVGLAGHALGGGYGLLSRLHGLLSDNIIEMKAVNDQGELLTINESHESELYWALRGGGGGLFVIVIEFKIRLVKSPLLVTNFTSIWYSNMTKIVMQRYQSLIFNNRLLNLSNNIFLTMGVNNIQVGFSVISFDLELEEFNRTISLLLTNLPTPYKIFLNKKDWLSFVYEGLHIGESKNNNRELLLNNLTFPTYYFKGKHLFYNQTISDHSLDQFIDRLKLNHSQIQIAFDPWDGYLSTIPVNNTAFPYRCYKFGIQFMIGWNDTRQERELIHRLNQIYLTVYKDSTKHSYINYIDRDVDNWMNVYYHTHRERLIRTKRIYDKNNRFYFEKTIE